MIRARRRRLVGLVHQVDLWLQDCRCPTLPAGQAVALPALMPLIQTLISARYTESFAERSVRHFGEQPTRSTAPGPWASRGAHLRRLTDYDHGRYLTAMMSVGRMLGSLASRSAATWPRAIGI